MLTVRWIHHGFSPKKMKYNSVLNSLRRVLLVGVVGFGLAGCATSLVPEFDTAHYAATSPEKSGIYFYQRKTGFVGAAKDVSFVLDDKVLGKINKGEYLRFEIPAGSHKVRIATYPEIAGPIEFKAGQNYFFRGQLSFPSEYAIPVTSKEEIDQTVEFIKNKVYEHGDVD